ncbi:MAG: S-adenosylmethionine decarboxylase family protein, partial [Bacteroidia bacterium]
QKVYIWLDMPATMHHYKNWETETDPVTLKNRYAKVLEASGFQILSFMDHHFSPQGYTAVWLLGESHFAIHTFPEDGRSYIELTSCHAGKHAQFLKLLTQIDISPSLA